MPSPPGDTRTVAPPLRRERAEWLLKGRKQDSRPRRASRRGNRQIRGALLAHLRQPRSKPEPGRGGATASSSDRRKRRGAGSTRPGPRSAGGLGFFLCPSSPGAVATSQLSCVRGHTPRPGSAQLFLIQQPIATGQQCARRARRGGGRCVAPAGTLGPGRGPGTWRSRRVKGAEPHCCRPPPRSATAAFSKTPISPGAEMQRRGYEIFIRICSFRRIPQKKPSDSKWSRFVTSYAWHVLMANEA
ncbi:voltage-dependent P/Q-type calcium channel subunit alpha-1A-like [Tupaia chinensis]|uniref:voltage-dependent P/Q-type calcium channel subunit alpha-1A-like n=1 Tax=Tupaia chinensis TaxID=246437 RepID=UPI0003C91866|nr:voltage-dependent P/Q-type calcium channel subunit alpha-1A-like [Tupaia chinensis]